MSNCLHGHFLGVGCPKCPKVSIGKLSPLRKNIIQLAVKLMKKAEKEKDPAEKESMLRDIKTLMHMRSKY